MVIIVSGSRHWTDKGAIREAILALEDVTLVIQGEARGADTLAKEVAKDLGIDVEGYHALWDVHGRAAGVIRNQLMLDEERPDMVLAFPLPESKGTLHMIKIARKAGVEVQIVKSKGE